MVGGAHPDMVRHCFDTSILYRRVIVKMAFRLLVFLFIVVAFSSCALRGKTYENISRGIYDGANQAQEINKTDPRPQPDEESLTYDRYQQERRQAQ
jgi:hypothetical protein